MSACMTSSDWTELLSEVRKSAPVVGRLVRIGHGKHRGKIGRVFYSAPDRFARVWIQDACQAWIREAGASYGYRIGVDADGERFFTKADYAFVCIEEGTP